MSVGGHLVNKLSQRLKVTGLLSCNDRGQIVVTLRPYGAASTSVTRSVPCHVDSLRHFRHVSGHEMSSNSLANQAASLSRNCLECSDTWIYYLDPLNWLDSVWTSARWVISIVAILVALFAIGTIVKCCLCLRKCTL